MPRRELARITERVYCVRRPAYMSCSYVVVGEGAVVFVDSGMDPDGLDMTWALERLGRPISELRGVLVTHWHNDHCGGAAALHERTGVPVYHHADARAKLQREERSSGLRRWLCSMLPEVGALGPLRALLDQAPPRALREGIEVVEGDRILEEFVVWETPGHETGHLSFWFEPERVLFTGDAIAVVGDHVSYMSRWLTGDVDAARASMLRCMASGARALCPGHRQPLLDPDPAMLDRVAARTRGLGRWPVYGS
jgi:glyoxylase-like metal-dependent hydrolase (beta-lactamase superfamily II)